MNKNPPEIEKYFITNRTIRHLCHHKHNQTTFLRAECDGIINVKTVKGEQNEAESVFILFGKVDIHKTRSGHGISTS